MARQSRSSKLNEVQYVECRTLGHAWRYTQVTGNPTAYVQHLQCMRCRSDKHQELDAAGFIVRTSYTYSQDYLLAGMGRLDRSDRATLRVRAMNQAEVPFVRDGGPRTHRKR